MFSQLLPEEDDVHVAKAVCAPLFWATTVVDCAEGFANAFLKAKNIDHRRFVNQQNLQLEESGHLRM